MKNHTYILILFLFLALGLDALAQNDTTISDSSIVNKYNISNKDITSPDTLKIHKNRQKWVTAGSIVAYSGALVLLNQAWYAQYPRSSFHFYNDNAEWNQMDKVGHGWSTYQLTRASYQLWKWAGVHDKKALLYAGLSGPGFLTVIEVLDGFSTEWGFSWGDMAANIGGSGLFLTQQALWKEQRIQYKFSFHQKKYTTAFEKQRAADLFGNSWSQRMLKDYNAQTYWLSANIHSFFPKSGFPKWLNIAIGYSADNMFGGYTNTWINKNGIEENIAKKRERFFYVSPDIDLTKIKSKSKLLNTVFFCFNSLKIPLPAIGINTGGKLVFHPVYF